LHKDIFTIPSQIETEETGTPDELDDEEILDIKDIKRTLKRYKANIKTLLNAMELPLKIMTMQDEIELKFRLSA
jgi:hypothetical protein